MGRAAGRGRGAEAGDLLLHPAALLALGLLVLNDHMLKSALPGPLTGKLSDAAGLAFFPVLLVAALELALALVRRWSGPSSRQVAAAVVISAAGFALVKVLSGAAVAFGWALGVAQALLALPLSLAAGTAPVVAPARVVADPTDLIALPALALPLAIGLARSHRGRATAPVTAIPAGELAGDGA